MKRSCRTKIVGLVIAAVLIVAIAGVIYAVPAYRKYLDNTSYVTRAWDYLYVQPRDYVMGYVAQSENIGTEDTLCVDVYAAPVRFKIPEKSGVVIYVASDEFTYATDCPQIIYVGKDGYEPSDFGWDSYLSKYRGRQDYYHMTELPFHFGLHLTPMAEMASGAEGSVHVVVIPFTQKDDLGSMDEEALMAWIEEALDAGDPDGIEIPYYFDGEYIYWSSRVIAEVKSK